MEHEKSLVFALLNCIKSIQKRAELLLQYLKADSRFSAAQFSASSRLHPGRYGKQSEPKKLIRKERHDAGRNHANHIDTEPTVKSPEAFKSNDALKCLPQSLRRLVQSCAFILERSDARQMQVAATPVFAMSDDPFSQSALRW